MVLKMQDACKTYTIGKSHDRHVLKNLNIYVEKGEFISIMGPSGSGKSTLLYTMSGMDQLTSGWVIYKGRKLTNLSEKELSRLRLNQMGFIFQHIHLLKNLCIFDNIVLSAYLSNQVSRKKINNRAIKLMEKTGIKELAQHDISQASGGQLQRVAICRALINDPEILFGDEPTGALDSKSASEIMDILKDIHATGTTILLVTHDVKVAARSERVLYMIDGKIVAEKKIGKFNGEYEDLRIRENMLMRWISECNY